MNNLRLLVNIFLKKMRKAIEVLLRGEKEKKKKTKTKHRKWKEKITSFFKLFRKLIS